MITEKRFPFCSYSTHCVAVSGAIYRSRLGHPTPAFSCACGCTGFTSIRDTKLVHSSSTPQTPMEHLEVRLGRLLLARPERCKPNLGFRLCTQYSSHLWPTLQHQERIRGELNSTFKPKVHRFKYPSNVSSSRILCV